jgi:hypothetical protein
VKRVLLFTMEGSVDGEAALAFLQARGAAVDLFRRLGRLGVPTIVIDDRAFVGFEAHRLEIEALVRE